MLAEFAYISFVKAKNMPCPHCRGTGKVNDPREIGALCRSFRVKAGLSLRAVADGMGISAPYLSDLERGRRMFNPDLILKMQDVVAKKKGHHE